MASQHEKFIYLSLTQWLCKKYVEREIKDLDIDTQKVCSESLTFFKEHDLKIKHWKIVLFGPTLDGQSPGKGLIEVIKKKLSINVAALDPDYLGDYSLLSCFSSPMTSMCARWIDQAILDEEIAYSEKKRRDLQDSIDEKDSPCSISQNQVNCNETVYVDKAAWRSTRTIVNQQIRRLRSQLYELKEIRSHLKAKRPNNTVFAEYPAQIDMDELDTDLTQIEDVVSSDTKDTDGKFCNCKFKR